MSRIAALVVLGILLGAFTSAAGGHVAVGVVNSGRLEHVELRTTSPTDLTGWILSSGVGGQSFVFGAVRTAPGMTLRVVSGTTQPSGNDVPWTRANVWNNEGDIAMLFDRQGLLIAEHTYGRVKATSPAKASSAKNTKATR